MGGVGGSGGAGGVGEGGTGVVVPQWSWSAVRFTTPSQMLGFAGFRTAVLGAILQLAMPTQALATTDAASPAWPWHAGLDTNAPHSPVGEPMSAKSTWVKCSAGLGHDSCTVPGDVNPVCHWIATPSISLGTPLYAWYTPSMMSHTLREDWMKD